MESLQDLKVEGVTEFAPPPAIRYRYIIQLKSSKLSIWMEDRTSKKQWFKGDMDKTSYVSSSNAIPDASAADYVKCFQETLDSDPEDSSDAQRKLHTLNGGALQLELAVKIRVLRSTWLATYTFDLDPVSVERIDMLESKLRDQQEDLEKLRNQQEELSTVRYQQEELDKLRSELKIGEAPPFITLTASKKHAGSILRWGSVESDHFVSTGLDGVVKTLHEGVYSIGVITNITPGTNQCVLLRKNRKFVQEVYPGYCQGYYSSASFNTIERLENKDELTITCVDKLASTSYLTIVRLGN